eukprot:CAMPEP_0172518822 /NCGR_PEP_ID=MMETSP1066-20121228/291042_1 /TAXON_ID=671091 /ORGANISM="Coscinodiscus wailesii, Strain CCMP2513" /LENGTH=415 /DNA_ID=CAMNT_0013301273 /DNA_START=18 /DNA_END=1267 /DNA_ORIENTATION=-
MKPCTLPVKVFTSLAFVAKFAEGLDCALPPYTGMLSAADPSVANLYCTIPKKKVQELYEEVIKTAFETNAQPPNNFLATCFPSMWGALRSRIAGLESQLCKAGEIHAYPYVKITTGLITEFLPWEHEFCINFDICDKEVVNRYLASLFLQAHMAFGNHHYEFGYYVIDHYVPSAQCAYSLRTISEPEMFCSGAFNCDFPSLVNVSIGNGRSFEVAICINCHARDVREAPPFVSSPASYETALMALSLQISQTPITRTRVTSKDDRTLVKVDGVEVANAKLEDMITPPHLHEPASYVAKVPGFNSAYPYAKITTGFITDFLPWEHEFCINFDICDKEAMNRYLAPVLASSYDIYSAQCAYSLITISEPETFCSGAFNCDFPEQENTILVMEDHLRLRFAMTDASPGRGRICRKETR